MSVDLRTRVDGAIATEEPPAFFSTTLPEMLERHLDVIRPGAKLLDLRPFTFDLGEEVWSLVWERDAATVVTGPIDGGSCLRLRPEQLTDLIHDQTTPISFYTRGALDMPAGGLGDFLDWWLVLRAALDSRPLHTPGAVTFKDRDGAALDLKRAFRLDDTVEEMSHFLHEAGFLHLTGIFSEDEMAEISADMDCAAPLYRDGDGHSWWATVSGGTRRLVRMQGFDEHSAATRRLLQDRRFLRIGEIPADGHVHKGLDGNRIEALFKPIGVVEGISDVPWHKDCSIGRHSYECCSMTAGISVTGASATSGQLRVVAGSHRALIWPAMQRFAGSRRHLDLPEVDLPTQTGDVTVHLSCTLHMAQPPVERERRVMYTSFRLPLIESPAAIAARARLRSVREGAHTTVSQEPAAKSETS